MARGADLSKTLDDKEIARLRAILRTTPDIAEDPNAGGEYPKMLYHKGFVEAQQTWVDDPDPKKKQICEQLMKLNQQIVFDPDGEEEYLADGWRHSPADFYVLFGKPDPRIPTGREARRAATQKRLSTEDEITQLRMRLAELTGSTLTEEVKATVKTVVKKSKRAAKRRTARELIEDATAATEATL